ncbi:MAG: cohesin domain-containing protein [Caldilineales bacterium]
MTRYAALAGVALTTLLVAGATTSQAAPAVPITLTVVGPSQPVSTGQTFLVTVRVSQAADLGAFEFGAAFNGNLLSTNPDWMALTHFLGSTGRSTGELRIQNPPNLTQPVFGAYSYGDGAGPAGSGDLATIQFRANAAGSSALNLTQVQVTDTHANILPVTVVPGSVTVQPSSSTRRLFLPMLLRRQ